MNDKRNLPEKHNNPERSLTDIRSTALRSGNLLDTALANLSDEDRKALFKKATEEALDLEIKASRIVIDHDAARRDLDNHVDTFNQLKRDNVTGHKMKTTVKTATGSTTIESRTGTACFVATVAFKNADDPNVIYLRWYRDTILLKNDRGKRFTAWYYRYGPQIAVFIQGKVTLEKISRVMLKILVAVLRYRQGSMSH